MGQLQAYGIWVGVIGVILKVRVVVALPHSRQRPLARLGTKLRNEGNILESVTRRAKPSQRFTLAPQSFAKPLIAARPHSFDASPWFKADRAGQEE